MIVAAGLDAHHSTELAGRIGADDVQRSPDGVSAEKRSLGPAQDLYALQVKKVRKPLRGSRNIDPVNIDSHGRVVGDEGL
ncbi:hypothetical protein D3C73_1238270 [compost metagenome]